MLYKIAHLLRDKMSWLWDIIEQLNSLLFSLKYGKQLKSFSFTTIPVDYKVMLLREMPTEKLVAFFDQQPEELFVTIVIVTVLFLAYVLIDKKDGEIAGYCFNRSFFHGVGYRGRMVDSNYRGKGLGTAMNKMLNEVGFGIGLRLFETVSKDNVASYRSALSASNVKVVKELPHNELYLEIVKP